jgi:D-glycero-D-manno-heptose 1,7-bisphosphate phosphatase
VGYLGDPDGIRFLPGAVDALHLLRQAGCRLVLVTNQAGVARGLITESDVRRVHGRLRALLAAEGVVLDGIYYCPHHPEHGPPQYRIACDCRKPAPGMVRRAAAELGVDPGRSAIFGDHLSDAGVAAAFPGMRAVLLLTGHGASQWEKIQRGEAVMPDLVAPDLLAGVRWFLAGR